MKTVRASIRELLYEMFPVAGNFEEFVCDYFEEEYKQISAAKISYQEKVTMLLERTLARRILDALHSFLDSKQDSYSNEDYSYLKKSIEQLIDGESIDRPRELKSGRTKAYDKTFTRYRWLKKIATWTGVLYVWELLRSIWKQLDLSIRSDGNGKIIIVSTAGGCLAISTGIWSCYYRDKPLFEHMTQSQQVNFCIRDLSIKMTPAADMELDKASSSSMIRLIAQAELGNFYTSEQRINHQMLRQSISQNPYFGYGTHFPSFFSDCGLVSDNRLRIDLKININNEIQYSRKSCYQEGRCFDSFVRSATCDFSFLVHDDLDEYECPVKEFSFSSSGMSYLEVGVQPLQIDSHQRAIRAFESCKGAISSIALLGACRRRGQSTIR